MESYVVYVTYDIISNLMKDNITDRKLIKKNFVRIILVFSRKKIIKNKMFSRNLCLFIATIVNYIWIKNSTQIKNIKQ